MKSDKTNPAYKRPAAFTFHLPHHLAMKFRLLKRAYEERAGRKISLDDFMRAIIENFMYDPIPKKRKKS